MQIPNALEISLAHSSEGHQAAIYSICEGPKGSFYTGDGNGWLVQWQLANPAQGKLIVQTGDRLFAMLQMEETIWAGTLVGHLLIINVTTKAFRKIDAHQKGIFGIYSWGEYILTIGGDGCLKYWTTEGQLVFTLGLSEKSLRDLAFHPEKGTAIIGASDASIYEIDLGKRQLIKTYPEANNPSVFCLTWINEHTFISGGRDAKLITWKTNSLPTAEINRTDAHWYTINDLALHPRKEIFATASRDRTIKIWDKSNFALLKVIDAVKYGTPNGSVNRLLWLDQYLISVGDDRKVNWWQFSWADQGEAVSDKNSPQH